MAPSRMGRLARVRQRSHKAPPTTVSSSTMKTKRKRRLRKRNMDFWSPSQPADDPSWIKNYLQPINITRAARAPTAGAIDIIPVELHPGIGASRSSSLTAVRWLGGDIFGRLGDVTEAPLRAG